MDLTPKAVTAALLGVESPLQTFALQRAINTYPEEPLLAILPGVALQELWGIVGIAETALLAVSAMVVVTALIGMMATIFSSLNERRLALLYLGLVIAQPMLDRAYGLWLPISPPGASEAWVIAAVIAAGAIVSLVPAARAYRLSLADGMMVRH
jgi:putative ABC transport system permease protein